MPPQHTKSRMVTVLWPAWVWAREPATSWIFSGYSEALSVKKHSIERRDVLRSEWYQHRWGDQVTFSPDQDRQGEYQNEKRGTMTATATGGTITGKGGDFIVVDDPLNPEKAHSDADRLTANRYFDQTLYTRQRDMRSSVIVIVMHRLHDADVCGHVLEADAPAWTVLDLQAEAEKATRHVFPVSGRVVARAENELLWPDRFPLVALQAAKRILGSWAYCTPGYSPVLMSDWSERRIADVQVGDEVIGFSPGPKGRMNLARSTVLAISRSRQPVNRMVMENEREAHCTAAHRWYRRPGRPYSPAKIGTRLHSVYTPSPRPDAEHQRLYDWLGGLLDGEGSCHGRNTIYVSQSARNPDVQQEISRVLTALGFAWSHGKGKSTKPEWAQPGWWWLNGGRSMKMRLLAHAHMAKRQRFIDNLWATKGMLSESTGSKRSNLHKVATIEPLGMMDTFSLQTTTGNYVVWGYASKNSAQYQQRATPTTGGLFHRDWWHFWGGPCQRLGCNGVAHGLPKADETIQSWDCTFKDTNDSDFVAGHVYQTTGADVYMLDRVNERMSFNATLSACRTLSGKWPQASAKLVEDKANGAAVINTLQHEIGGFIAINPEGGKFSRASASSPFVEAGNIYLPHPNLAPWVHDFIDQLAKFPKGAHDDDVDAFSQAMNRLLAGPGEAMYRWTRDQATAQKPPPQEAATVTIIRRGQ